MNLIVYVSDALRTDHVGCYGARYVATPTIDEFARGGVRFDQAIAAAPWTAPSTTSMITGLYPHHHRFLHWDVRARPGDPDALHRRRRLRLRDRSFVFDENYLFKGFADANVVGTSERLDGVVEWLRAPERKTTPFCLWFHSWATHMPYDVLHTERKEWLAAKEEIIEGIQSDRASALEALREGYKRSVEHSSETLFASFLETLDEAGLRDDTAVLFVSDHGESWGERFLDKTAVKGTYHMHGATLYDEIVQVPLILAAPGLEPAEVGSQVSLVDLTPTMLDLGGAPLDGLDGSSLLPLARRPRAGRPAGAGRRHRQGRALPARRPDAPVEADPPPRDRRGGGVPARRRPARAAQPRQRTSPPSSGSGSTPSSPATRTSGSRRTRRRWSRSGWPISATSSRPAPRPGIVVRAQTRSGASQAKALA